MPWLATLPGVASGSQPPRSGLQYPSPELPHCLPLHSPEALKKDSAGQMLVG